MLACPVSSCLLVLELKRGKAGMKNATYQHELGATAAYTVCLLETSISDKE